MDYHSHLRLAKWLAEGLDEQFQIGSFKFGLDPLIDLIPILGDVFTTLLSLYIVWIGIKMRLPAEKVAQMMGNVVFDSLLSLIPVLGNLADFAFKSNLRNIEIIEKYVPKIVEGKLARA